MKCSIKDLDHSPAPDEEVWYKNSLAQDAEISASEVEFFKVLRSQYSIAEGTGDHRDHQRADRIAPTVQSRRCYVFDGKVCEITSANVRMGACDVVIDVAEIGTGCYRNDTGK
jgi:hypothetical protein